MDEKLDASKGWCCDGRTWVEHAMVDGECCQAQGTDIDRLPPSGKAQAEKRKKDEQQKEAGPSPADGLRAD